MRTERKITRLSRLGRVTGFGGEFRGGRPRPGKLVIWVFRPRAVSRGEGVLPELLGRVRRNFKHVMLVDVREVLLLGDPLSRIRSRSPETVQLLSIEANTAHTSNKQHAKKNLVKQSQSQKPVNSAVVMGGARGVRRLSNAMLTEIVRVTTQHKKKNAVTESGLFNPTRWQ